MLDIIGIVEYTVLYLHCLFYHKLFLCPTSSLSDVIIIVFTYDVILLINMILLWLHNAVYFRYFDYVLH